MNFVKTFGVLSHGIVSELCDCEPVVDGLCGPDGAWVCFVRRLVVGRRYLSMEVVGCAKQLRILERHFDDMSVSEESGPKPEKVHVSD